MRIDNPEVSVIIPYYNRPNELKRAISSVANQSYTFWRLIIIDDGSTEGSLLFLQDLPKSIAKKMTVINQINRGPGIARRTGLSVANGKYIQYLDSDDEILPEKIEKQIKLMEIDPDAIMCYSPSIQVNNEGKRTGLRKFSTDEENDLLKGALQWRRWHTSSCLWRYPDKRKALEYWTDLYNGEDVVHDVSAGIDTRKVLFVNEPLTICYSGDDNLSATPRTKERQERLLHDTFRCPDLCHELLKSANLDKELIYSEPLAERFLYNSLKLAKMKDLNRAIIGLSRSLMICRNPARRFEIALHLLILKISGGNLLFVNRILFNRVHRILFSPSEHYYRRI